MISINYEPKILDTTPDTTVSNARILDTTHLISDQLLINPFKLPLVPRYKNVSFVSDFIKTLTKKRKKRWKLKEKSDFRKKN